MTTDPNQRGGAPVGFITELDGIEAASVIYLRLWCDGSDAQSQVWTDFTSMLGPSGGRKAVESFEQLCALCSRHGRRPLIRHAINCKCLGADEACFANLIASAANGKREDALMIAILIVRPDIAPLVASLAAEFGFALKRMRVGAPRDLVPERASSATLH